MKTVRIILIFIVIFITNNSHSQWISQGILTDNLIRIRFANENTGYVLKSTGNIFKSTNGGSNWISQLTGITLTFVSFSFINENTGWIQAADGTVLKTVNGGVNWAIVSGPIIMQNAYDMCFLNANTGYMLLMTAQNNATQVRKTTDGGYNWDPSGGDMFSPVTFFFLNDNTGWLSTYGYNSAYFKKTTNGGINWNFISNIRIGRIFFINENTGFGSGINGLMFKSTNGGLNWDTLSSGTTNIINSIQFLNEYTGYAVGSLGTILRTSNCGINWILQTGAGAVNLSSVNFINQYTGWIVGVNGLILKTTNGGLVFISKIKNNITDNFSLSQNYPNPFNPSTKIKFKIPSSEGYGFSRGVGLVTLKVFDITGREIKTLVNESLQPGTYEVLFDGSKLKSGVYFYQLISGEFKETKKMLLLK